MACRRGVKSYEGLSKKPGSVTRGMSRTPYPGRPHGRPMAADRTPRPPPQAGRPTRPVRPPGGRRCHPLGRGGRQGVDRAGRLRGPSEALGRGADLRPAGPVSAALEGIRADRGERRGVHQGRHDPPDDPTAPAVTSSLVGQALNPAKEKKGGRFHGENAFVARHETLPLNYINETIMI